MSNKLNIIAYCLALVLIVIGFVVLEEEILEVKETVEQKAVEPTPSPEPEPEVAYVESDFSDMPGWANDDKKAALSAWQRSCKVFLRKMPSSVIGNDFVSFSAADIQPACQIAVAMNPQELSAKQINEYFEKFFKPVKVHDYQREEGLFTGYYEPKIKAKKQPDEEYNIPLYKKPDDLITVNLGDFSSDLKGRIIRGMVSGNKLRPYHSRADINKGVLANRSLELLWTNDVVDRFFLEIQGSGMVEFEDGTIKRIGYASQNGNKYSGIGSELIRQGALTKDNASMQSLRKWLNENPDKRQAVLETNQSFVFFQLHDLEGPFGAMNVALTPERSLAVDRKYIPMGLPIFLSTKVPSPKNPMLINNFQRLMVAQDTGGAIKGAVRGDVFWGAGYDAAMIAGHLKSAGEYWLLLPKTNDDRA